MTVWTPAQLRSSWPGRRRPSRHLVAFLRPDRCTSGRSPGPALVRHRSRGGHGRHTPQPGARGSPLGLRRAQDRARGRRLIGLDPQLVLVLREHWHRHCESGRSLGLALGDDDLVFARPDGAPGIPSGCLAGSPDWWRRPGHRGSGSTICGICTPPWPWPPGCRPGSWPTGWVTVRQRSPPISTNTSFRIWTTTPPARWPIWCSRRQPEPGVAGPVRKTTSGRDGQRTTVARRLSVLPAYPYWRCPVTSNMSPPDVVDSGPSRSRTETV